MNTPIGEEALTRIAAPYGIERQIRGSPPEERQKVRTGQAEPLFTELEDWLDKTLPKVPGRSEPAKAMRYAITRMKRLRILLDDGKLELDNNAAERAMHGLILGRKNWLFAGSDSGGERAAALATLIETAKLNYIDPQAWLAHVLDRIADHPINGIGELLPWNWSN